MCCPLRFSEVHPWKSLKFRSHFLLCLRPSEMMQVNIYIQYTVTLIRLLFNKNVLVYKKNISNSSIDKKMISTFKMQFHVLHLCYKAIAIYCLLLSLAMLYEIILDKTSP